MRKIVCAWMIFGLLVMVAGVASAEENPLMNTIQKLYGVPYKASGTSKNGFDCSGFTSYVFESLGVKLPHSSAAQYKIGQKVARKDLQPGDLVFFNTNGHSISHVGIYIGNNTFVHSETGRGVVKTSLSDPYYWKKRYVGATRVEIPAMQVASGKQAVQAASLNEGQAAPEKN